MDGSRPGRWRDSHLVGVTSGSELSLIIRPIPGGHRTIGRLIKRLFHRCRKRCSPVKMLVGWKSQVHSASRSANKAQTCSRPRVRPSGGFVSPANGRSDAEWPPLSANVPVINGTSNLPARVSRLINAFVDPTLPVEFFLTARDRVSRHHKSAWRVHRPKRDSVPTRLPRASALQPAPAPSLARLPLRPSQYR